jgi:hypothetical protein
LCYHDSDDHVIIVDSSLPDAKTGNDRGFRTGYDDLSIVVPSVALKQLSLLANDSIVINT